MIFNYHNSQLLIQWSLSLLRPLWRDVRNKQTKASSKPKKQKKKTIVLAELLSRNKFTFFRTI